MKEGEAKKAGREEGKKECLFHFDKFTEIRLLAHKKTIFLTFEEIPIYVQPLCKAFLNGCTSFRSLNSVRVLHFSTSPQTPTFYLQSVLSFPF